jgi:hypothetical protein
LRDQPTGRRTAPLTCTVCSTNQSIVYRSDPSRIRIQPHLRSYRLAPLPEDTNKDMAWTEDAERSTASYPRRRMKHPLLLNRPDGTEVAPVDREESRVRIPD